MSVLRAYSWLRGMAPESYPVTDCHTELQSVACIQERHTEMDSEKNTLKFQERTNMVGQLEFQQWHFGL